MISDQLELNQKTFQNSLGKNGKLKSGTGPLLEMEDEIANNKFKNYQNGDFPSHQVDDIEI